MWKEGVGPNFKYYSSICVEGLRKTTRKHSPGKPVTGPGFEAGPSQLQNRNANKAAVAKQLELSYLEETHRPVRLVKSQNLFSPFNEVLVNGFGSETSKLRRLAFSWKTEKMD
jgi:hemin uptake protein HemP